MVQQLAAEILTSDSDEIADLKANIETLEGFINLAREIDNLPDTRKRFFEESRSLYQVTTIGRNINELETMLAKFFGSAIKPSGKPLPRKLRKNSVVKYLGGIQKDQSLFLVSIKTGQFYGALWPWRRNKTKVEVHFGYCSDWMSDEDYDQLESLVKRCISHNTFKQMNTGIGGQIHGISLPSFLQMAEMEKSSFSLRITSLSRVGYLHLKDGKLIDADVDDNTGAEAAYQIISWDEASIEIKSFDESKSDTIKQPLMHVLMESLKRKDEIVIPKSTDVKLQAAIMDAGIAPPQKPTPRSQRPSPGRLVRLERAPTPKIKRQRVNLLTLAAIVLGTAGLMSAAYMASLHFTSSRQSSRRYEKTLTKAENATTLELKKKLFQEFIDKYPESLQIPDVQSRLLEVNNKIEDRVYDQVQLKISAMPVDEHYEKKAIATYEAFLNQYPNSRYKRDITKAIGKIKDLIDQFYYQELKQAARLDFSKRLGIYRDYLAKFPEGSYGKDVGILIEEMGKKHLAFLNSEAAKCETQHLWESCIKQYDEFIQAFQGMELGREAIRQKSEIVDKQNFFQLQRQVMDLGTDYQKGYGIYQSYLETNPQTTQRDAIEKEMANLKSYLTIQEQWLAVQTFASNAQYDLIRRIQKVDRYLKTHLTSPYATDAQSLLRQLETERNQSLHRQQIEAKKRQEQERIQREKERKAIQAQRIRRLRAQLQSVLISSERFQPNGDGTVLDRSTGLTWAMLDSQQEQGSCLTYNDAQTYIQNLNLGGQKGWRFPTASELASIYKKAPYYPSTGNQWYWSSEIYTKGYHSVVVVVTDEQETVFKRENRTMSECGVVRAIR